MHFWLWQSYGISSVLRFSPLSFVFRELKVQVKYKDKSFSFVARRDFTVVFEYIVCMISKTQILQILKSFFLLARSHCALTFVRGEVPTF